MSEENFIDLEEAERIAKMTVSKKIASEIRNTVLESSDFKDMGGIPIFEISGFVDVVTKPKSLFSPEKLERKYFNVKIHAKAGKILAVKL